MRSPGRASPRAARHVRAHPPDSYESYLFLHGLEGGCAAASAQTIACGGACGQHPCVFVMEGQIPAMKPAEPMDGWRRARPASGSRARPRPAFFQAGMAGLAPPAVTGVRRETESPATPKI